MVECIIPSSRDPLPNQDALNSFNKICPKAALFSLIPTLPGKQQSTTPRSRKDDFPVSLMSFYDKENKTMSNDVLLKKASDTFSSYNCSVDQISNLFKMTKNQNVSPLWYEHRKGRITGTKAHDVLVRRASTPPENLIIKIMNYKSYNLNKNDAVKWGLDNESVACEEYIKSMQTSQHANFKYEPSGFMISAKHFFMGATTDGVISCDCCGCGNLEIKCPFKYKDISVEDAAKNSDFCLDEKFQLRKNHRYFTQTQFQMFVYDCNYCDFVVMTKPSSGISMLRVRLYKDCDFCQLLFDRSSSFVLKHVIPELLTRNIMDQPQNAQSNDEEQLTKWCLCEEPEYGKMVFCENSDCKIGWFHYPCVNMKRKPSGKWICPQCKH
jgi:hypothetical protein